VFWLYLTSVSHCCVSELAKFLFLGSSNLDRNYNISNKSYESIKTDVLLMQPTPVSIQLQLYEIIMRLSFRSDFNSTSLLAVISTNRYEFMNEDELLVNLEAFSHPPKCLRPEVMLMRPSPRSLPTPTTRLLHLRVWQLERNQAILRVHPLLGSHILCLPAASYNCGKVSTVWMRSGAFDKVWPTAIAYPILPLKNISFFSWITTII